MTGFFALLRLQLLSRYADMKPRNLKTALRTKKGRTIGMFIAIAFLILYMGGILIFIESSLIDILMKMGAPDLMLTLAMMLSSMGTLILGFFLTMSVVYLGRDAGTLASLPLRSRTIFSAKLTQVWISETFINAILLIPACIFYGTRTGAGIGFYLSMIVVWLTAAIIPICVSCLFSSLLVRVSALWKHREMILTVGGIVLMVAYMFVMSNLGSVTGNDAEQADILTKFITSNKARIETMTSFYPPAGWAVKGLTGNAAMLALFAGVSLAAAALTVWLLGFSFRRLSLLQAETPLASKKKKLTGNETYNGGSAFMACCRRELKTILRVPSYATNILPIAFMPLLMTVMLTFIINNNMSGDGESLQIVFGRINPAIVMGALAALMAYMSGMNPALSTAVTREGKGHDFMTALPIPTKTIINAKFAVGFGLSMAGLLCACVALVIMFPAFATEVILAFILCLLFSCACDFMALNHDIKKPKLDWVTEQEAVKQNFGVLISMLLSWAILSGLALLTYFLISWGLGTIPVFLILAALLGAFCAFEYRRTLKVADRYYCQG